MFLIATGAAPRQLEVLEVLPRSPASEAGVRQGDLITAVDGRPAKELSLEDVRATLRQREDRQHLLSLRRGQRTLQIKLRLRRLV
jgi:carboxyl-terminal processing protease